MYYGTKKQVLVPYMLFVSALFISTYGNKNILKNIGFLLAFMLFMCYTLYRQGKVNILFGGMEMLAVKIKKVKKLKNGLYEAIGHLITKWNINTLNLSTGETAEKAMENLYWKLNINAGCI